MSDDIGVKLDAIWADDLLGRRLEAQLIVDYLQCAVKHRLDREDMRAFTLAIDTGYGAGKSFFLRRLSRHLEITHPVAFIDAWADDLSDEPFVAIAATLQRALAPLTDDPTVKEKIANVFAKAGELAKVVSAGIVRRGLATLISESGVEAASAVLSDAPDAVREAGKAAAAIGDDVATTAFRGVSSDRFMKDRIEEFEARKAAVADLKRNLETLIASLRETELSPPIVIVIDELDRCRPNYAIKVLEEIKHLFDVPGLVFIFGMHGEQLAHSVSAAYGSGFSGGAYLRRFVSRRYVLREPNLEPLVTLLLKRSGLSSSRQLSSYFRVTAQGFSEDTPSLEVLVTRYVQMYGLAARDAYGVVETLQTSAALAEGQTLYLPYLLPLVMSRVLAPDSKELVPPTTNPIWDYVVYNTTTQARQDISPWSVAKRLDELFRLPHRDFHNLSDNEPMIGIAHGMKAGSRGLSDPSNYRKLLEAVGRFGPVGGEDAA